MTVKHLFPAVEPSLNLDFANSKKLDPRITFTRSSTGTYVDSNGLIKTAAANEARFDHDGASGSSLGLLVEESRTNLITYSEQFDNAAWIKTYPTINANVSTAPDGTLTADEVVATNIYAYVSGGVTLTAATYTASIYARANTATSVTLYLATSALALGASCVFDLSNGTAGSITHYGSSTGFSSSIQALPGGWYRCSITGLCTAALWYHQVGIFNNQNNSMYFWGAQLEAGSFPTSYIPTSGSTVTRSADVASMTGTNFSSWYNQSEGTVLLNATASGLNTLNRLTYITDGSSSNSLGIVETPTATQFLAYTSGVNQASLTYNQIGLSRKAFVYKTNDTAFVANAGTVLTDTSITLPTLNQVDLNSRLGSNPYTGHISRFTYYPFRLTDAQLQALTL